jgi:hypothetical protein
MEDNNQSGKVQQPAESELQNPTNQQSNTANTQVKDEGQEKEGLEQHGSIKNTK